MFIHEMGMRSLNDQAYITYRKIAYYLEPDDKDFSLSKFLDLFANTKDAKESYLQSGIHICRLIKSFMHLGVKPENISIYNDTVINNLGYDESGHFVLSIHTIPIGSKHNINACICDKRTNTSRNYESKHAQWSRHILIHNDINDFYNMIYMKDEHGLTKAFRYFCKYLDKPPIIYKWFEEHEVIDENTVLFIANNAYKEVKVNYNIRSEKEYYNDGTIYSMILNTEIVDMNNKNLSMAIYDELNNYK